MIPRGAAELPHPGGLEGEREMKRISCLVLALCLLAGCGAPEPEPTPAPEATPASEPVPMPEATQDPAFAWLGDPNAIEEHVTIEGFYHRPFEELPQELRDSLTWDGEVKTEQGYSFWLRTYTAPGIEIVTTEAPPESLDEYLETMLENWEEIKEDRWSTQEDLKAEVEGEKGREWLYSVTVTDDSYATPYGLKVGLTEAEAIALGYPLKQRKSFGTSWGNNIIVSVEQGRISEMHAWWAMGRYVGRYWDI